MAKAFAFRLPAPQSLQSMTINTPKYVPGTMIRFFETAAQVRESEIRQHDPKAILIPQWIGPRSPSEENQFQALKLSIEQLGRNIQPIKLRPMSDGGDSDPVAHQVVFGAGRLRAALELGLPVLAFIDGVDDRTAFVDYFTECRHAPSWRPWRLAHAASTALDIGLFPSQRRLAEAVGCQLTEVQLLLHLSQLPAETLEVVERLPLTRPMARRLVVAAGRCYRERLIVLSQAARNSRNLRMSELVRSLEAAAA